MQEQVLNKLVDSFDDFKERLIRIEESVKSFKDVKDEVDTLKVDLAEERARSKSAHKRIDELEAREKEKSTDIKWLKRQVTGGIIGLIFTVLAAIIVASIKGWI